MHASAVKAVFEYRNTYILDTLLQQAGDVSRINASRSRSRRLTAWSAVLPLSWLLAVLALLTLLAVLPRLLLTILAWLLTILTRLLAVLSLLLAVLSLRLLTVLAGLAVRRLLAILTSLTLSWLLTILTRLLTVRRRGGTSGSGRNTGWSAVLGLLLAVRR